MTRVKIGDRVAGIFFQDCKTGFTINSPARKILAKCGSPWKNGDSS
ncbi:hypothetical protein [Fischerella thermalis]